MNTQHLLETEENLISERELKLSGFVRHMEQQTVDKERDLLIFEIASQLKLVEDLRFMHFKQYCKDLLEG